MTTICLVFAFVYLGMILGRFPYLKIGRPAIALVGAVFLLADHQISGKAALESVDFGTLGMLFGLMLISAQFEISGLYTYISKLLGLFKVSPFALLGLMIALAGTLSALLTNDVVAVAMAPVVLGLCVKRNLNPVPFLLGVAFATNAGEVATMVGSPQNMLISQKLNISFASFIFYTGVPALLALATAWLLTAAFYRNAWTLSDSQSQAIGKMDEAEINFDVFETVKALLVTAIVIGLFLFTSCDKGLVAISAGCFLLLNGRFDSRDMVAKVDWGLLLLFFGLFVVNASMDSTGLPAKVVSWLRDAGVNLHEPATLFITTAVMSDLLSNVPSVMLLLPYASDPLSGPLMVLSSGLSSNMIIIGSLANIIVVDAAAKRGMKISFWEFAKVGLPISLISMILGGLWVVLARHMA